MKIYMLDMSLEITDLILQPYPSGAIELNSGSVRPGDMPLPKHDDVTKWK